MKKIISIIILGIFLLTGFGPSASFHYEPDTTNFSNDDNEIRITITDISYEIKQDREIKEIFIEALDVYQTLENHAYPPKFSQ